VRRAARPRRYPRRWRAHKRRDRCPSSSRWPRPTSSDQQAKLVEVEGQKIDGGFYALSDTCTQRRGPFSEGTVEGAEVTCPWHGATFDIRTGAVLGPPVGRPSKATR
jgi:Rieske Fe-S protein